MEFKDKKIQNEYDDLSAQEGDLHDQLEVVESRMREIEMTEEQE